MCHWRESPLRWYGSTALVNDATGRLEQHARRFRSSLTMLVAPGRGRLFRNSRRGSLPGERILAIMLADLCMTSSTIQSRVFPKMQEQFLPLLGESSTNGYCTTHNNDQIIRRQKHANTLVANAKTLDDWIKAKREAKNLTPSHLAAKMGIAAAVIYSWEDNTHQPDSQQLADLSFALRCNLDKFMMHHWQSMSLSFEA